MSGCQFTSQHLLVILLSIKQLIAQHFGGEQIESSHLVREISQLISQSFTHLDESERQLMRRFGLTVTQYIESFCNAYHHSGHVLRALQFLIWMNIL